MEIDHIKEHPYRPVLVHESIELGHKVLVVRLGQLPADMDTKQLPAIFFIE